MIGEEENKEYLSKELLRTIMKRDYTHSVHIIRNMLTQYPSMRKPYFFSEPSNNYRLNCNLLLSLSKFWDDIQKQEILKTFLHNHEPLISALSEYYGYNFKDMSLGEIKTFFKERKEDLSPEDTAGLTPINYLDFKDVHKKHTPQPIVKMFAGIVRELTAIHKERFLHNYKPLTEALSEYYGCDFKGMSLGEIRTFCENNKKDFPLKDKAGSTIIEYLDFKDVHEKHVPQPIVKMFAEMVREFTSICKESVISTALTGTYPENVTVAASNRSCHTMQ